jgi:UDP-glucose 4-epimerase
MKKIWITGSRGFIGKELISILKQNNEIKCFTHNVKKDFSKSGNTIQINFLSEESITKLIKKFGVPDIFIHLGWASMTDSDSKEHLDFNVNVGKNLIKKFFELGLKKFVFIGSRDEYGEKKGSLIETMKPVGNLSKYAKAKSIVAKYGFKEASKIDRNFIHLRLFNVYGAGQQKDALINMLYRNFHEDKMTYLGPCMHFREYIHISEVCKAIEIIIKINKTFTVNIGSGKAIELKKFINLFWKELGGKEHKIIFDVVQIRKNDPVYPNSHANLKKLKELTGWSPSLSIENGVKLTIKKLNLLNNHKK